MAIVVAKNDAAHGIEMSRAIKLLLASTSACVCSSTVVATTTSSTERGVQCHCTLYSAQTTTAAFLPL